MEKAVENKEKETEKKRKRKVTKEKDKKRKRKRKLYYGLLVIYTRACARQNDKFF